MVKASHPDVVATEDPAAKLAGLRYKFSDFDGVEVGPLSHLAGERSRLSELKWRNFDASMIGATVGAEIDGVDISSSLSGEVLDELHQALIEYKVIFLRNQKITSSQQVSFAESFGDLEIHPFIPSNTEHPKLVRFEKGADVGGYENSWHHDVTWREAPSKIAVLRAISVPSTGGDTMFSDMCAAYEGLEDSVKSEIENLIAVHDFSHSFGTQVPEEKRVEMRGKYPLVEHPVVGTHPETGKRYLFVNRIFVNYFKGFTREESLPLINLLSHQAEFPEYQCRFRWSDNSIAVWDNRLVQHYALSDYWPDVRIMERASVIGEPPKQ
tara:strand:+ start:1102 stop:2076 length:975 start_codon:yes stop_codon:yes gene_type:complete